jgi:hypothetical protein
VVDDSARSSREWKMSALDLDQLKSFLSQEGLAWHDARSPGDLVVSLSGDRAVATLVKKAVLAGVPICKVAPRIGHIAHTYLQLNEERR